MKTQQLFVVLATVVPLAGCPKAVNVNSDPGRHYNSDMYECERDARLTLGAKSSKPSPTEVKHLKDQCMKARGWRQVEQEETR